MLTSPRAQRIALKAVEATFGLATLASAIGAGVQFVQGLEATNASHQAVNTLESATHQRDADSAFSTARLLGAGAAAGAMLTITGRYRADAAPEPKTGSNLSRTTFTELTGARVSIPDPVS